MPVLLFNFIPLLINRQIIFMANEDDDAKDFLVRIINTIAMVMLWMMVNVFFGFYKDYAFFEQRLNWTNYLFYAFSLTSFVALIVYLYRKWKL
jgi:ABC-type glycerol-3-phosphate transport system permease component